MVFIKRKTEQKHEIAELKLAAKTNQPKQKLREKSTSSPGEQFLRATREIMQPNLFKNDQPAIGQRRV